MLEFRGISFWYDITQPPPVYKMNLRVDAHEFLAIVGISGGGKSTVLRLGCGLLQLEQANDPESGYRLEGGVYFDGAEVNAPLPMFGYVPQAFSDALIPSLNARDNVLVAVREQGISKEEEHRTDELMSTCGIIDVAHVKIRKLSGGQQQRVAICRALITGPRVLFMDEPFANLDPSLKPRMGELLHKIRQDNPLTVFLVTHDIKGALELADRVLCIRPGYAIPSYMEARQGAVDVEIIENWMRSPSDEPITASSQEPSLSGARADRPDVPGVLGGSC